MGSIPTRSRHPGPSAAGPDGASPGAAAPSRAARRRRWTGAAAALAAWLAWTAHAGAQTPDTVPAGAETGGVPAEPDTAAGPPISPLGAFARSFVVPGWGQAEVDEPVRGSVYFAAQAASVWMMLKSQAKVASARRGADGGGPGDPPLVESRVSQREDWIVLSVFVALMSGVDAWVSTHLYGFEGELEPPEDGSPGVQLRYSVPVPSP